MNRLRLRTNLAALLRRIAYRLNVQAMKMDPIKTSAGEAFIRLDANLSRMSQIVKSIPTSRRY